MKHVLATSGARWLLFLPLASLSAACNIPGSDQAKAAKIATGLTTNTATSGSSSSSAPVTLADSTTTLVPAPGARAVKIIFKNVFPAGSFDSVALPGPVNAPGKGLQAMRVFNADGSLLAQGGSASANWPKWFKSFEIGLSGVSNPAATNPDCARFAGAGEDSTQCDFNVDTVADVNCGAYPGLFRVSEYDCARAAPTDGNGGPNDGVYLRAVFNRDPSVLAVHENIMVVLEYAASALNPPPSNPTACFNGGSFKPSDPACSDMTWQSFLKHSVYELTRPFLMLVPPAFGYVNTATNIGGSGVSSKQFYLPLAGDVGLTVLQLSRIHALSASSPNFAAACNGAAGVSNSPLCLGMILYSMTFFRI